MLFTDAIKICQGTLLQLTHDRPVVTLVTDSRKAVLDDTSLFLASRGERHDGHHFLAELYQRGVRQFIVEKQINPTEFPQANILQVKSAIQSLQHLAAHHRRQFTIPVVGITGSNGKTIIKEWLYQMLAPDFNIVKNPGSYNSQIGVPLSVWQLQSNHTLGIFEAGISQPGEMERLAAIILPTVGIFSNLGSAHDEGFTSREEKATEKARLFSQATRVIYCKDHTLIDRIMQERRLPGFSWGVAANSDVQVKLIRPSHVQVTYQGSTADLMLPVSDAALQEDVLHVIAFMLLQGYDFAVIQERLHALKPIAMRLELKQGINRCVLIDDTYNNDLAGLKISLDFLRNQQKQNKTLILSDILQTGLPENVLAEEICRQVSAGKVTQFIGIGTFMTSHRSALPAGEYYEDTAAFLSNFHADDFADAVILVKGARSFRFENIVKHLERKVHGTVMEIDLNAMISNLNYFKSLLRPGTRLMVMVKAFAYGSGSEEVANLLQYHRVDYLGVAYADEGVELRKNNITLPIMVMNPSEESFGWLLQYNLEPEIYSLRILRAFVDFLGDRPARIHLKLDTGMHRLGFDSAELDEALPILQAHPSITVASVFSHLSGADEKMHDDFSTQQADSFITMAANVERILGYRPIRHLLNSPGILRFPNYQFDMVRLGIGLYGVDPTEEGKASLKPVAVLKTIISQVKRVPAGETIGYGRKGKAEKELKLATLAIGYADGFSRSFSRGAGHVLIQGKLAPVLGNVCMDMTMVDITGIEATEGDEAIIFGPGLPIQQVAKWGQTIPYEILTNTSDRVKRVFFAESI